jgi:hypothetical protein
MFLYGAKTLGKATPSRIVALSTATFSIMTLSTNTLSTITLSISIVFKMTLVIVTISTASLSDI